MPHIIIDAKNCKGCALCMDACPRKLIVIGTSPNSHGYFTAASHDAEKKCTGCALCAQVCPDIAIEVYK